VMCLEEYSDVVFTNFLLIEQPPNNVFRINMTAIFRNS
jgi:hypothetical protein